MGYTDIIIAVHGIGDQKRNETVRSVATRLARLPNLAKKEIIIAPQPLGYFYTEVQDAVKVAPLDRISDSSSKLAQIGFSEVYWADIPGGLVEEKHTLEETKAWARTVASRARSVFLKVKSLIDPQKLSPLERLQLREPDFSLAAEVLDEIVDTVYVLENLFFLAEKAGVAKFSLREILDDYVGDVQVVTEFGMFRQEIIGRFTSAMEQIHSGSPNANLHIVAHSEGTVVSFLGLLQAMSKAQAEPNPAGKSLLTVDSGAAGWLENVRGYMTIGSPIDKHLLLWPELFDGLNPQNAQGLLGSGRIKWRNYYDFGDPVGFKLNTARTWLDEKGCKIFEFREQDDFGFSRYLLPGKAHTDYWADSELFEHFVSEVILHQPKGKIRSRWATSVLSPSFPYLLSFLTLLVGAFLLYRTVWQFTYPSLDPVQNYVRLMTVGSISEESPTSQLARIAFGISILIAGVTLFARWPRLAKGFRWWLAGAAAFLVGCLGYYAFVPPEARADIGAPFLSAGLDPTWGTLGAACVVALIGMTAIIKPKRATALPPSENRDFRERVHEGADRLLNRNASRRTRWFSQRMRPLIAAGAAVIGLVVLYRIRHPIPALSQQEYRQIVETYYSRETNQPSRIAVATPEQMQTWHQEAVGHAEKMEQVLKAHPSVWPVGLAAAAFLYLWWLAALIFDLAFVWQRYVRDAVILDRMNGWREIRKKHLQAVSGKT